MQLVTSQTFVEKSIETLLRMYLMCVLRKYFFKNFNINIAMALIKFEINLEMYVKITKHLLQALVYSNNSRHNKYEKCCKY